jgi:hypothetical protein
MPVIVPLERDAHGVLVDGAFFAATNMAVQVASEIFSRVLQATLLTFRGAAGLGALRLSGGVPGMPYGRSMSRSMPFFGTMVIGKRSTSRLRVAYDLILGGRSSDKTLTRAFHRFLLGRNRADFVDKLVDYVIAWEALLLTQEGNALAQEMSYRFSINGAALLFTLGRQTERTTYFKKMLSAYRARSAVVHGGTDADRDKALGVGGFQNIGELCTFLEDHFRETIFWL